MLSYRLQMVHDRICGVAASSACNRASDRAFRKPQTNEWQLSDDDERNSLYANSLVRNCCQLLLLQGIFPTRRGKLHLLV